MGCPKVVGTGPQVVVRKMELLGFQPKDARDTVFLNMHSMPVVNSAGEPDVSHSLLPGRVISRDFSTIAPLREHECETHIAGVVECLWPVAMQCPVLKPYVEPSRDSATFRPGLLGRSQTI